MTREGPLRAEDRRPAARLRQDHHARARRRQGHQAARPSTTASHLVDTRFEVLKRDAEIACCAPSSKPPSATTTGAGPRRSALRAQLAQLRGRPRVPARCNIGSERMARRGPASACRSIAALPLARRRRARRRDVPHRRRGQEPHHPLRHAHRGRAQDHQPPHRGDHPDARGAAVAEPPEERARVRRRPPRAHGRQGLSEGPHARADVRAGALHGHRRHLRGAHRQGPALQEGQDAVRIARRSSGASSRTGTSTRTCSTSSCARRSTCATREISSIPSRSTRSTSRAFPATGPELPEFVRADNSRSAGASPRHKSVNSSTLFPENACIASSSAGTDVAEMTAGRSDDRVD